MNPYQDPLPPNPRLTTRYDSPTRHERSQLKAHYYGRMASLHVGDTTRRGLLLAAMLSSAFWTQCNREASSERW